MGMLGMSVEDKGSIKASMGVEDQGSIKAMGWKIRVMFSKAIRVP